MKRSVVVCIASMSVAFSAFAGPASGTIGGGLSSAPAPAPCIKNASLNIYANKRVESVEGAQSEKARYEQRIQKIAEESQVKLRKISSSSSINFSLGDGGDPYAVSLNLSLNDSYTVEPADRAMKLVEKLSKEKLSGGVNLNENCPESSITD